MKKPLHSFLGVKSPSGFGELALTTFKHQFTNNPVYRSYCNLLSIKLTDIKTVADIPYLPIEFFKHHQVKSFAGKATKTFSSSGTTSTANASHHVGDLSYYESSFLATFNHFYGCPKKWAFLALLPSYIERGNSSLVYMMKTLIKKSNHALSNFYLNEWDALHQNILTLEGNGQPTLFFGVSFALLDFAEKLPLKLNSTTVMETGGMKGRRKEITRAELHLTLQEKFGTKAIHSEYGMTELLSQAYAKKAGRFVCPKWMRVTPFEINDPFCPEQNGKVGRLNIIDLANQESCAFIATDDIGRQYPDGSFEVIGRLDASDIRGCNLLAY